MERIEPIQPEEATGKAKGLLDAIQAKFGKAPNIFKTIAQSA